MKLVVLTGIPGSGSTTLLNKALEEVDYVPVSYTHLTLPTSLSV